MKSAKKGSSSQKNDYKKTRREKFKSQNTKRSTILKQIELDKLRQCNNHRFTDERLQRLASDYNYHKDNFADLTKKDFIDTGEGQVVIEAVITNDGLNAIVLSRPNMISDSIEVKIYAIWKVITNESGEIKQISPYCRKENSNKICASQEFTVRGSNIQNGEQAFIKAIQIVLSEFENVFALAYFDTGYFRVRIFDIKNQEIAQIDNINEMLKISNQSIPVEGFNNPNITVKFCSKNVLFVNIYCSVEKQNIHFFYDYKQKLLIGEYVKTNLICKSENFPVSLFKNEIENEMYQLYREGQFLTIAFDQKDNYNEIKTLNVYQQLFKFEGIGESHYIKNKILAVHYANQIIFFKREPNSQSTNQQFWEPYHRLTHQSGCCVFYSINTSTLICVSLAKIFFYKIDSTTLLPELEQQIFNFMSCNRMVQGPFNRVAITYSTMQEDLIVFRRKQVHKFKAEIESVQRSNFNAISLVKSEFYIISNTNCLQVYDQNNFYKPFEDFEVCPMPDIQSQTWRNPNILILNMIVSQSENLIAVVSGVKAIDRTNKIHKLHIFEINQSQQEGNLQKDFINGREITISKDSIANKEAFFKKVVSLDFEKDIDQKGVYISTCMRFDSNEDLIWVIDLEAIHKLDYMNKKLKEIYKFESTFCRQPNQFQLNTAQNVAFIVAGQDSVFIHIGNDEEIDYDQDYQMLDIRCSLSANNKFYVLSNRYIRQIGVFLMELDQDDPCQTLPENQAEGPKFLMKYITHLEISDADMYFLSSDKKRLDIPRSNSIDQSSQKYRKTAQELLVGYKTIYSNTYTVNLIDIQTGLVIFKYESFHKWESQIKGILLSTCEYLTVTRDSVEIMGLSSNEQKKTITEPDGNQTILHSLQECQYLKITEQNHLNFSYVTTENGLRELEIGIADQYQEKSNDNEQKQLKEYQQGFKIQEINQNFTNKFEQVYKILIQDLSLNQLLLLQGLYSASSQTQISNIIEEQPNPQVFYKSLLELDMSNLISIFSVDSRMIKAMLHQKYSNHFSSVYPIFYKVRNYDQKDRETLKVKSAIDIALDSNQMVAAQEIMLHIVKYQNSYIYSFLFEQNLPMLLFKGINITPLLKSDVVFHEFSFEGWPETSNCEQTETKPYNGSLFQLRNSFSEVFPQKKHDHEHVDDQLYKIKYTINLLPSMADKENIRFMDLLGITDFLDIYDSKSIQNLIDFKWQQYAKWIHYVMFFNNSIFFIFFMIYTNLVYNEADLDHKNGLLIAMLISNSIFMFYDMQQLCKQTFSEYFSSVWNIMDQALIWIGYGNIYFQYTEEANENIENDHICQILMITLVILILIKTFFYLRIFQSLTELVIMIKCVLYDLTTFMMFFFLLLLSFSFILSILGFGNFENGNDDNELIQEVKSKVKGGGSVNYPGSEYRQLPIFMRNILIILRFSLGDFDFEAVNYLEMTQAYLFWFMWIVIVMMSCIIFLNFIIAEVSQSYTRVTDQVEQLILQERIKLIDESEQMMNYKMKQKNQSYFPMYLITKEVEN